MPLRSDYSSFAPGYRREYIYIEWVRGGWSRVGVERGSGIAKLGHTGARTLAARGCAPPVQALLKIIRAECTVINRELAAKSAQRC